MYLTMLEEELNNYESYNYKIIVYCLIDNYVHIMLKIEKRLPGESISRINSLYIQSTSIKNTII